MKQFLIILIIGSFLWSAPISFAIELNLKPAAITVKTGTKFDLNILAESNQQTVAGVEIRLKFDPRLLEIAKDANNNWQYELSPQFNISDLRIVDSDEIVISAVQDNPAFRQPLAGRFAKITFLPKLEGHTSISIICDANTSKSQIIINDNQFTNSLNCQSILALPQTQVTIMSEPVLGAISQKPTINQLSPFTRDLLIIIGIFTIGLTLIVLSIRQSKT